MRRMTAAASVPRHMVVSVLGGLLACGVLHSPAYAQTYPERNLTLIVPFAAGGASDVSSRIMADSMAKILGQTVIVENVAGAGGATGSLRGKNARPDGYTIGFGHMGTHSASVAVNPKLPYDPRTDFDYLGIHLVTPNIMIMRKDLPVNTLQEFIAYAKAKGKDLKMGAQRSGLSGPPDLRAVLPDSSACSRPTSSFRGFGQTINDILSGAIDGTCEFIASVTGHVKGGSVKGFGVAADERSPVLPDVPTSTEGGLPAFKVESWLGLYAPKGLPPEILAKLRATAVQGAGRSGSADRNSSTSAAAFPRPSGAAATTCLRPSKPTWRAGRTS